MSKSSRRRQGQPDSSLTGATPLPPRTTPGPGSNASPTGETTSRTSSSAAGPGGPTTRPAVAYRQSAGPLGTARTGRRTRSTYQERSFVERFRGTIIGVAAVVGVALIGVFVFASASAPKYQCTNLWEATATTSPAPDASPAPGYVQDDMGRLHLPISEEVKYTYCPPASGAHYFASGVGPIPARFYGVNDKTLPQGWIHNLEHGAMVLLYRGDSEGATQEGQLALRAFFDGFPNSPVCNITPGTSQGPVIARLDEMATPFAALVWGRVLPLANLDTAAILEFYRVWGERTNPEPQCAPPTPSPTPIPNGGPSASPGASASAAPSGSADPSASAVSSASPSAS